MVSIPSRAKAFVRSHKQLHLAIHRVADGVGASNVVRVHRRKEFARTYFQDALRRIDDWAPRRTENDNFYYDLTEQNRDYLASLIALLSGSPPEVVAGYLRELADDRVLRQHIEGLLVHNYGLADVEVGFGRREGWYALIRAFKPRTVVETGVHHGVGACVIAAALLRNAEEGQRGCYYGTDIDPNAGGLFTGRYASCGRILYGDSLESLRSIDEPIDLFINDSDHSAEYEAAEYDLVAPKLAERSLILGDNSHVTTKLAEFARTHARPFVFFREEPLNHWYPGAGIGISPSAVPLGTAQ